MPDSCGVRFRPRLSWNLRPSQQVDASTSRGPLGPAAGRSTDALGQPTRPSNLLAFVNQSRQHAWRLQRSSSWSSFSPSIRFASCMTWLKISSAWFANARRVFWTIGCGVVPVPSLESLKSFAASLQQDYSAVRSGFGTALEQWSNRRTGQPTEAAQAPDVWSRQSRFTPVARLVLTLTARSCSFV